jgi:hypothetical protein
VYHRENLEVSVMAMNKLKIINVVNDLPVVCAGVKYGV